MHAGEANAVELRQVSFSYPKRVKGNGGLLYDNFSFCVANNSTVVIMGASGLGKSTLGKLIAGLLRPAGGAVVWGPQFKNRSDIVYLDQHSMNSVFPWQDVETNIEYPLRKLKWARHEIHTRKSRLAQLFRLDGLLTSYPAQLSGGELQRLAFARCLSWRPRLMVLDESFSALDRNTKEDIFRALRKIAVEDGLTLVLITHNVSDALALGTRCVVLDGRPIRLMADVKLGSTRPEGGDVDTHQQAPDDLARILYHAML